MAPPTSPPFFEVTTTSEPNIDAVYADGVVVDAPCSSSQLVLRPGPLVREPTGRHSLSLSLVNTSPSACELVGYPIVALVRAGGRPLAFDYRHERGQVVTGAPPAPVEIAPGRVAHATIDEYRCDRSSVDTAAIVELTPPGAGEPLSLPVPDSRLGYCGPDDPGSVVDVSPVEPTQGDTLSH